MCQSKSSQPARQRSGVNTTNDEEPAPNALIHLNLSRQFMEEVDNLTSQLLDNVIRDVIDSEDLTGPLNPQATENDDSTSLSLATAPYEDFNVIRSEVNDSNNEVSTQDATEFVEQLIDQVAEPVETEELRISAEDFLGRLIDEVSHEKTKPIGEAVSGCNQNSEVEKKKVDPLLSTATSLQNESVGCDVTDLTNNQSVADSKVTEELNCVDANNSFSTEITSSKKGAICFFVPAPGGSACGLKKPKLNKKVVKKKLPGLFEQPTFDTICDAFLNELINETLTLFNPLFQFHRAQFDGTSVCILPKPLESLPYSQLAADPESLYKSLTSSRIQNQSAETKAVRPAIAVDSVSNIELILERKVFDMKRWVCISRPQ